MGKLLDFFRKGKTPSTPKNPILGMLQEEVDRKTARQIEEHYRKASYYLLSCLIISLIGTMAPVNAANLFFSIATILLIFSMVPLRGRLKIPRIAIVATVLLAGVSITAGCSPLLDKINPEIFSACKESTGQTCGYGVSFGYSILGIPIRYATIDQARLAGNIKKVYGIDSVTQRGLVSFTRLTVYGGG